MEQMLAYFQLFSLVEGGNQTTWRKPPCTASVELFLPTNARSSIEPGVAAVKGQSIINISQPTVHPHKVAVAIHVYPYTHTTV